MIAPLKVASPDPGRTAGVIDSVPEPKNLASIATTLLVGVLTLAVPLKENRPDAFSSILIASEEPCRPNREPCPTQFSV